MVFQIYKIYFEVLLFIVSAVEKFSFIAEIFFCLSFKWLLAFSLKENM